MKRADRLLLKAAEALENGADPFNHEFLVQHSVTLDECMSLSERIGIICKGFLAASKDDQIKFLAMGAAYGSGLDMNAFRASIELDQTTKKLKKLNARK